MSIDPRSLPSPASESRPLHVEVTVSTDGSDWASLEDLGDACFGFGTDRPGSGAGGKRIVGYMRVSLPGQGENEPPSGPITPIYEDDQ